jgi:hypothetical protein
VRGGTGWKKKNKFDKARIESRRAHRVKRKKREKRKKKRRALLGARRERGGGALQPASGKKPRFVEAGVLTGEDKGDGFGLRPAGLFANDFGNDFGHFHEMFACAHDVVGFDSTDFDLI